MAASNLSAALDFFKTKSPSLVGVDIASTSLKLVELSEVGKEAYRLDRYVIEPLPKDTVADGNIANLDQVSDALKRAFKRLGSRHRQVALALPAAMVITKKIIVPSGQKEEELELTVEAEANQYIPFALDEVNLDTARRTAMFRVFRESLTNIARHAHATHVIATLQQEDDFIVLTVHDDGQGIAAEALLPGKSLGLMGMHERIRDVSGNLEITGAPDQGTTMTIRVPLA